jgi:Chaperone of endosialidase
MAQSPLRLALLLIPFVFAFFEFPPTTQAVSPAPDGGYPGGNTAEGQNALFSLTTGGFNAAVGFFSLRSNTTGQFNTAIGAGTLLANTADENTATGAAALLSNTTGPSNTANGAFALLSNTAGGFNTANGDSALFSNTIGGQNTATGFSALTSNTSGAQNTANGANALPNNTIGEGNIATGFNALFSNTIGSFNTAIGSQALYSNTTGTDNVASGFLALVNNIHGGENTALGAGAGSAVTTASEVTCIGAGVAGANVDHTTWIGHVYGETTQSGTTAPVVVSDSGQFGTVASSERFKKDIATMENASQAILALRPVTFHYKSDVKDFPQFGLIAEEVAKVNPALVLPDKEGKPYTVRYDAVNAMLLNEFLKEHHAVQELKSTVAKQEAIIANQQKGFESKIAAQQKQIEALSDGLQKVSAQVEMNRTAPQTVLNTD